MNTMHKPDIVLFSDWCKQYGDISLEHGYRLLKKHKDQLPPALRLPGGRKIFFRRVDVEIWLAKLANVETNRPRRGRPTKVSQLQRISEKSE